MISGHKGAIDRAIEIAKDMGAKRAVPLPVSAPFHCPLMQPAADAMRDALSYVVVEAPAVPLFANVTAQPETDPDTIRNQLVEQVTGMVRWRESIANMGEAGVEEFVELGGKVLGPMVKRIAAGREGDERDDDRGYRSAGEGDRIDVRSFRNDRAGDRRFGRPRQRDREGAGGAGRAARGVGQQCREARELSARRSAAITSRCRATCRTARRSISSCPRRSTRSAASSTSSSTMPASPATTSLMRMKDEEWDEVIRVNLEAAFRLMRAAARADDEGALRADHLGHFGGRRRPAIPARPIMSRRRRA